MIKNYPFRRPASMCDVQMPGRPVTLVGRHAYDTAWIRNGVQIRKGVSFWVELLREADQLLSIGSDNKNVYHFIVGGIDCYVQEYDGRIIFGTMIGTGR